jgi:hypothetical protein
MHARHNDVGNHPRALLARALLEQGERSRARGELQASRTTFESLGAWLDLAGLAQLDAALAGSQ